jgi:hypothetical protein
MKKRPRPRTKTQRAEKRAVWEKRRKGALRPRIVPLNTMMPMGTELVGVEAGQETIAARVLAEVGIQTWSLGSADAYCGRRDHQGDGAFRP